jgi:hypothetical protein
MNSLTIAERKQVVMGLVEGNSIRSTCRLTGRSKGAVLNLLAELGAACAEYHDMHVRNLRVRRLQCDEIWSFVERRRRTPALKRKLKDGGWWYSLKFKPNITDGLIPLRAIKSPMSRLGIYSYMTFRPFLVKSHPDMKRYRNGDTVPETGIYKVTHNLHRLPHEVVLAKDETFPGCAKCGSEVLFELAYAAPDLFPCLKYHIYELPELEEEARANRG